MKLHNHQQTQQHRRYSRGSTIGTNCLNPLDLKPFSQLFQKTSVMLLCASTVILTGCWQVAVIKKPPNTQPTLKANTEKIDTDKVGTDKVGTDLLKNANTQDPSSKETSKQMNIAVKTLAANASALGEPVTYDTHLWSTAPVSKLDISTVGNTPQELAKVISTDDNSLDYASHPAVKHRFMKNNAPYFDLVNSADYLEISWYYANPSDSDSVKEASISHAKKSHRFARQLMGDAGGQLVADILKGKKFKNTDVNGIYISLAKCEFYGCVLVMKKPTQPQTQDLVDENSDNLTENTNETTTTQ